MEPFFEVRYVASHALIAENARKYGVGPRPGTVVFVCVSFLAVLLFSLGMGILSKVLPMLALFAAMEVFLFFLPHIYAGSVLRNVKRQNRGIQPETVVSFGERIELQEGVVSLSIEYTQIIRAAHLKHSYKLWFAKRSSILLDPNCFTKGSFEEFKQFLREKCPNVTIPD